MKRWWGCVNVKFDYVIQINVIVKLSNRIIMRHTLIKHLLSLILCSGSLLVQAADQTPLCNQLRDFLHASTKQTSHVELSMFWGVRTEGNRIIMSERRCSNSGGDAEKQLCTYLLANSSSEFPSLNLQRAITCLQGYDPFAGKTRLIVRDIKLNFYEPKLVDFPVEVELELKSKDDLMLMRISAQRHDK